MVGEVVAFSFAFFSLGLSSCYKLIEFMEVDVR